MIRGEGSLELFRLVLRIEIVKLISDFMFFGVYSEEIKHFSKNRFVHNSFRWIRYEFVRIF